MSRPNIHVAVKDGITLGEGPHWVEESQELVYVNVPGESFHRYVPSTGKDYKININGRPTFIVPIESRPNKYIIGLDRSMYEFQWDGMSVDSFNLDKINTVEEDYPKNCFNDGKCDPQGRLWAANSFVVRRIKNESHQVAVKDGILLGEGPHWVEERQDLVYVDIPGQTIHRYVPSIGKDYKIIMNGRTTFIVPVESKPNTYIIGLERSMYELEWDGISSDEFKLCKINTVEEDFPRNRFNDGKCDPQGRLWAGTMGYETDPGNVDPEKGHLYKLDNKKQLTSYVDKIGISNGLAWSADSSKFYYIDSVTFTVDLFDFDLQEGIPRNRRVLFDLKKNGIFGLADGMTIDTQNNIWVAVHDGGKVLHIDTTTGSLIDTIDFTKYSSMLTSVAFGGPNLDELYVTSADYRLSPERRALESDPGALFKVTNVGAKGVGGGINYRMS